MDRPELDDATDILGIETLAEPVGSGPQLAQVDESEPGRISASPRALDAPTYGARYLPRRLIGQGGMGEIHACFDQKIGRDVALKVMKKKNAEHPIVRERFLREGRVQAQLEHPGVVPVYDLGTTPSGEPYLSMQRIRGMTFRALLSGLRDRDPALEERYPRRAVLSLLARVAETIAYAHSRGVVHRDLKPDNVMLGDFGEVNVLDWGVAKLQGESDLTPESGAEHATSANADFTEPGVIVGTAGYLAPEQAAGGSATVGPQADVYALGSMIFEAVTLRRLHPGEMINERLASTIGGTESRPSAFAEGIPPELDRICVRATEVLPSRRYPSAQDLLDDLRAFLDGARDVEMRREMAARHVALAREAVVEAERGGPEAEAARGRALRELGAAVALDPEDEGTVDLMMEVLLSPEDELPEEVERELYERQTKDASRAAGRSAAAFALASAILLPLLLWMGVRQWAPFAILAIGLPMTSVGAFWLWKGGRSTSFWNAVAVPYLFLLLGLLSAVCGPLFLLPALVVTGATTFSVAVRAGPALRRAIQICSVAAVLVPGLLQIAGVVPPSLHFEDGAIHVLPLLVDFPPVATLTFLGVTIVFAIITANVLVGRAVDALRRAERRLMLSTHRLRSALPRAVAR